MKVIAPTRSAASVDDLAASLGGHDRLHPMMGDVSTLDGARDLAARIARDHGPVDHVVASMGPW